MHMTASALPNGTQGEVAGSPTFLHRTVVRFREGWIRTRVARASKHRSLTASVP